MGSYGPIGPSDLTFGPAGHLSDRLVREVERDLAGRDAKVVDAVGDGVVADLVGGELDEVLALEVGEPGVRGAEIAPDGEVVEDDGGHALVIPDEEAGLGAQRLAADHAGGTGSRSVRTRAWIASVAKSMRTSSPRPFISSRPLTSRSVSTMTFAPGS